MRMRLKARRGEKYNVYGESLTFLEYSLSDGFCKLLNADGKLIVVEVSVLHLPEIETRDYEKIERREYAGD